ncbi:MAG: aminomethyl-transferring glycine dehydrogenase [Planctomycetota bacterium]
MTDVVSTVASGVDSIKALLDDADTFARRHLGPDQAEVESMLDAIGLSSVDELIDRTVPDNIRLGRELDLTGIAAGDGAGERRALTHLEAMASKNRVMRSCIGMGYHGTVTPPVILRNVLENPGWYTQYTPYQAEISQGRLEALLNYQTMVSDLTGMELAGASLLDEGTAAAEAMAMCFAISSRKKTRFFVSADCHPQTIEVVRTRGESLGLTVEVGDANAASWDATDDGMYCGVLVQYPTTDGRVECYSDLAERAHAAGVMVVAASDLLALTLLKPPGEWGADVVVGSAQRFGVPMGGGGPHAGFFATHERNARKMPGRIIGVSRDARGEVAYRMAIQTREQHIKRDRATSNICTAQALLAIISGLYAAYHGPQGLRHIAERTRAYTQALRLGLIELGHEIGDDLVFDTLRVTPVGRSVADVVAGAVERGINIRDFGDGSVGITLDEAADRALVRDLLAVFGDSDADVDSLASRADLSIPAAFERTSGYLSHPVFNSHHSETEMLRYITRLQRRDLSLAQSMIPLGSCTMKLNATSEMLPVSWPGFAEMHPFAPVDQQAGYAEMYADLESWLSEITGFDAVSLQPNAGSQGEYAGLMVIRAMHRARGDGHRDVCLIPESAHGTNPASAIIAGMRVVGIKCDEQGNVDIDDLRAKAETNASELAALMVTYPSTHGVFESGIKEICEIVHEFGGRVYMDGANLNAQVGLCRPGDIGADVCHLNLHKTFCIPHGGGGPGMGPIGVTAELAPFLPTHPVSKPAGVGAEAIGPISAAPYGSPLILTISWMYIAMMGASGLKRASELAILNANYMAKKLEGAWDVVYTGDQGTVAHEFIIDLRPVAAIATADDVAKRLMDYGFHAPTMSWPVAGTLMLEPTESESQAEMDRYCEALVAIRQEIAEVEAGKMDRDNNPFKNSPHPVTVLTEESWDRPYSRERAVYPLAWLRDSKFWPPVARIDNPFGDRNLMCSCPSVEEVAAD